MIAHMTAAPAAGGVPLHWYVALAFVLFVFGVLVVLTRRNLIYLLMGVELILNASSLLFVSFGAYRGGRGLLDGTIAGTFVVVLAAAEAVIALAIVLHVFGMFRSVRPEDPNLLKE